MRRDPEKNATGKADSIHAAKPLAGKRILVTRAVHQAGRLVEALEATGAEALCLPTIAIVPPESYSSLDAALEEIESFDWLIFTSVNGVESFAGRLRTLGLGFPLLRGLRVAAIGPATARAVRELGLSVEVTPDESVAESVASALRNEVRGKRVLLVRAAVGRDVIPRELAREGAKVEIAEAYQTIVPVSSVQSVRLLLAGGNPLPDAATFTSSSAVKNFLDLLRAAEVERPPGLAAVSIGPVTSATLREHGWEPAAEAVRSDIYGVVEACERLLASKRAKKADGPKARDR